MTPSRQKIHVALLALTTLLAACGPTRPSPDVLGSAQLRLAQARSDGASTYAPLELRFAEEKFDQAGDAVADRDYRVGAQLADQSTVNSELAIVKARLGKLRESIDALTMENANIALTLPDAAEGGVR
ncbi:MAG: DUF4398 domain-containing protein [Dokdonella sp.]